MSVSRLTGLAFAYFSLIVGVVLALTWAGYILAKPNHAAELYGIANRIMSGDGFRNLTAREPHLIDAEQRKPCNALEIRSAAVIRVRIYEDTLGDMQGKTADDALKALQSSVEQALLCAPTESFLWFLRYWTLVSQGAGAAGQINNLVMSYRQGPNEMWVELRRNAYALAVYGMLPAETAAMVRHEFATIVNAGFSDLAAKNLRSAGWPIRDQLLKELAAARPERILALRRALRNDGIVVEVPGVPETESRPWRN